MSFVSINPAASDFETEKHRLEHVNIAAALNGSLMKEALATLETKLQGSE